MRTFTLSSVILLAVFLACGGSGNPGDAVTEMFEAIQAGNGERAVSFMSSSILEEVEIQLDAIRLNPEIAVQQLSIMGIELDAEEIQNMTAEDFIIAMISSPLRTGMMQSVEITVGEVTIDGDTAKVKVTISIAGETETKTMDVIREDGQWKIAESGMSL